MGKMTLYHGSLDIIEKPEFGKGKTHNDYGSGFYCTENIELAKEWACTEGQDGYANQYQIETKGLRILNLSEENYTILHWLALLVKHREMRLTTPLMRRGAEWLLNNYLLDVQGYDIVIGYRADDSYFSFARAFLSNQISLEQLSYAMRLGRLGEQVVLISREAFERVQYISNEVADTTVYFSLRRKRDEEAREAYRSALETEDERGIYLRDLIKGGRNSDACV
ncbi:MAG: DUF3990 domain-containing protein [Lachnospiraceae bacterium]|nr:DUF3990 domain-containing protein [Lachnospiraceae bacterium]